MAAWSELPRAAMRKPTGLARWMALAASTTGPRSSSRRAATAGCSAISRPKMLTGGSLSEDDLASDQRELDLEIGPEQGQVGGQPGRDATQIDLAERPGGGEGGHLNRPPEPDPREPGHQSDQAVHGLDPSGQGAVAKARRPAIAAHLAPVQDLTSRRRPGEGDRVGGEGDPLR